MPNKATALHNCKQQHHCCQTARSHDQSPYGVDECAEHRAEPCPAYVTRKMQACDPILASAKWHRYTQAGHRLLFPAHGHPPTVACNAARPLCTRIFSQNMPALMLSLCAHTCSEPKALHTPHHAGHWQVDARVPPSATLQAGKLHRLSDTLSAAMQREHAAMQLQGCTRTVTVVLLAAIGGPPIECRQMGETRDASYRHLGWLKDHVAPLKALVRTHAD